MNKRYVNPNAQCPFYKAEYGSAIYCEGAIDGSEIRSVFSGKLLLAKHKRTHCYGEWERCPIAKMLWSKYE